MCTGLQTDGVLPEAVGRTRGLRQSGDAVRESRYPVAAVPAFRRATGRRLVQSRRRRHLRRRLRAADELRVRRHRADDRPQQGPGRQPQCPLGYVRAPRLMAHAPATAADQGNLAGTRCIVRFECGVAITSCVVCLRLCSVGLLVQVRCCK